MDELRFREGGAREHNERIFMRIGYLSVVVSLSIASGMAAQPAQLLLPGRWEITLQNELPTRSTPVTLTLCITPEQAAKPEPPKGKPTDDCKVVSGGLAGNILSFVTNCAGRSSSSSVRITYHGDRYEGAVELTEPAGTLRQLITARRLGPCETPAPAPQE